ncbi:hypothetical protein Dsin_026802 [Dipteronia sinensis]|uniref:Reverse transcriptase domain-containing protein n=1 Tax=Dipteronia sinensis TaxID=43782 RepID=A0AAD9ZYY3_9ROSI|nr:hypothetical protein Dsin_026802 [Dipteronia sinensis]
MAITRVKMTDTSKVKGKIMISLYYRRNDKVGGLLVKLDFEKAYDSVDHSFLDSNLMDMGFGLKWRQWVNCCISTPTMSVLVNGSPTEEFTVERGLRQGDPLSPFLFNIIVESLSCCIMKAVDLNLLKGATLGNGEVQVSHLQFADDTILFLEPKTVYLINTKRILRCFEMASWLKINFHKSCVVRVGKKVEADDDWAALFKCKKATFPITYLGLPLGARLSSKAFWESVLLRIQKRLASWKKKFLSKGGRLVLVWRFGKENGSLWKRVICAKYGAHDYSLLWKWNVSASASPFSKAVGSLFLEDSISAKILKEGLKVVVGDSKRVCFWNDEWHGCASLKLEYPRIFALSMQKGGHIKDFGS